jgi:integrase
MSTTQRTRATQGIRPRHSRTCRTAAGGKCNCPASYEAFVYLKREGRKVRKTFPTLAAARAWRADATHAANRGRLRGPSATTVREAADELLAGARDGSIPNRSGHRYKPAALRGYDRSLRDRILPALGHMRLGDVTRADVQDLADALTAEGLSASTVQNILDPLRVIYRRAIRRDIVAVDPTEHLELRRPNGRRERIATPAEAVALLAALSDFERALWATAFYTGMRRGELRAVRRSDVDLAGRGDPRPARLGRRRGGAGRQERRGRARRADPGPARAGAGRPPAAPRPAGDPLVFGLDADRPFYPSTVRNRALAAWRAANERARDGWEADGRGDEPPTLKPIGLHEARHTCASVLIASGANPKVFQAVMGHATIGMTFDQDGHLMPGGLEEAAAAANAYLAASL